MTVSVPLRNNRKILVMDLDGTLIRSDTTHELLILIARWMPFLIPLALYKLFKSRSEAKRWMVKKVGDHIDPEYLPYEPKALELMESYKERGDDVWLVSGSDHTLVERIAKHLGMFCRWQGTEPDLNLTSSRKAKYLTENCPNGFVYAGNSSHDFKVWKQSQKGYAFNAPAASFSLHDQDGKPVQVDEVVAKKSSIYPIFKAMRLHQWAKNILLFVVPGLILISLTTSDFLSLAQAFVCFGLMASGTYILNDLFDIPDDRKHKTKKLRQIAAGNLSVPMSVLVMGVAVLGALIWAYLLDPKFGLVLSIYGATTIAYSFRLKRLPIVDVFVLACLFSLRVWAGAEIVNAPPTAWLMTFIGLTFLSLALAKRYVEVSKSSGKQKVSGRGYQANDDKMLMAFGGATAYSAVLSFAIYGMLAPNRLIESDKAMIVISAVVAAWFMRIWLVAGRGELDDDPVLYAVKDKISLACLVIAVCVLTVEETRIIWERWL